MADESLLELDIWTDPDELSDLETMIENEDLVKELELSVNKKEGGQGTLRASLELIVFGGEEHVLLIFTDITEKKRAQEELRESRRKLVELEEQGRLTLARELHDGVIQQLLGINHALTRLDGDLSGPPDAPIDMKPYRQEVLRLVDQLRQMITDLRPAGLEEFGLENDPGKLCRTVACRTEQHDQALEPYRTASFPPRPGHPDALPGRPRGATQRGKTRRGAKHRARA